MNTILFFDLFASTYLLFLGFSGFKYGFFAEFGKIIGLIITLWVSVSYYIDLAEIIQQEFSFNPVVILFLSFFILFSLTFIITRIILSLVDQLYVIRKTRYFNQILGFILGVFKGIILVTMVLWMFELLPYQKWTDTLYNHSTIARNVRYARDATVKYFGWESPIAEGQEHIRALFQADLNKEDKDQ